MQKTETVYVKLLEEDVDVWRPVEAEWVAGDRYRLLDEPPDEEVWSFVKDDLVRCERRRLSGPEDVLVALSKA